MSEETSGKKEPTTLYPAAMPLRLPQHLHDELVRVARLEDLTISEAARNAIRFWLKFKDRVSLVIT